MSAKLAWIRSLIAQITFADQQQVIVAESRRAFTAETANLVNAHTICTNAWNLFTFINVCAPETPRQEQAQVNTDARIKLVRN